MNNATGKRLLALIRDADYAHPGEEEANRLLFAGLTPDPGRRILDAGCGGGGTAAWVQARGLGVVTGLEIDAETVRLARERHPAVTVVEGDLQRAGDALTGPFGLTYSMTALYAVPDQAAVFEQLAALAAPGGELRLLEYSDPAGRFAAADPRRASLDWWRPLRPGDLPGRLAAAGWRLPELRDLSPRFLRLVRGPRAPHRRQGEADRPASSAPTGTTSSRPNIAAILDRVREGSLGGVLVRATLPSIPARPHAAQATLV